MKIQNTPWKTVSEETQNNGLIFGYEAPASEKLLRNLQKDQILVQVIDKTLSDMPRFIRPDNSDAQFFTPEHKFRIMEGNQTFDRFEKIISSGLDGFLPSNRFDDLVSLTDPKVYGKVGIKGAIGYFLNLKHLSDEKKEELKSNLADYTDQVNDDKILILTPKKVEALRFLWKMATKQSGEQIKGSGTFTIKLGEISSIKKTGKVLAKATNGQTSTSTPQMQPRSSKIYR